MERGLKRQGFDQPQDEISDKDAFAALASASIAGRVALGIRAGKRVRPVRRLGRTRGKAPSPLRTGRRVQPSRGGGHRRTQSRGTGALVPLYRPPSPLLKTTAYSTQRTNPDSPEARLDGWYATPRVLPHRVTRKARGAGSAAESQPGFGSRRAGASSEFVSRRAGASSEMATGECAQTLRTRGLQTLAEMCKP